MINRTAQGADNGLSQNNQDIGKSNEGRYIGGVRDTSAPTGGRDYLLNAIIAPSISVGFQDKGVQNANQSAS